jgi:hypothetical protein
MRVGLGIGALVALSAAVLPPAFAGADVVVPRPVKPQVVQPQVVTPTPAQAPAPTPSSPPTVPLDPPPTPTPRPYSGPTPSPQPDPAPYDRGRRVFPGHPSSVPRPPEPVFPPFPNLPWPEQDQCDAACLQEWQKFLDPLVGEGGNLPGADGRPLARPGPACDRDCLGNYVTLMRVRKMRGAGSSSEPPSPASHDLDPGDAEKVRVAGEVLKAFGLGGFFDPPRAQAPSSRIPQGSVEVLEGPVYLDKGSGSAPKAGGAKGGKPAGPPPSGPAADDIGDWDGGNPYSFEAGAPNAPDGSAGKKPGGIFSLIDDLLDFAQQ